LTDDDLSIVRNDEQHRYEARLGGQLAGFADFVPAPGRITFTHTEVDSSFEHHGVAGRLIAAALDDARARALAVVPRCPFVADFIEHHPDYADLVAADPS